MRSLSLEAIILKRRNLGEYDQDITLFSPTLGKIQARAKGARKVSSAFAGHLEPLNICKLSLHRSARGFTITQCQADKTFRTLRGDLKKSIFSLLVLEVFQKSTLGQEQGCELFSLISETLERLSAGTKDQLIIESFKIKLLDTLGALPDTGHCSSCRKRWNPDNDVTIDNEGHINCIDCDNPFKNGKKIPFRMIRLLHFICRHDFGQIARIALRAKEYESLRKISGAFLERFLDREIVSEKILNRI